MKPLEDYFYLVSPNRRENLKDFHKQHLELIDKAKGSASKHQAWAGGYRHHLEQCLAVAMALFTGFDDSLPFDMESVVLVLYFHDIEKMYKYVNDGEYLYPRDKEEFYKSYLPLQKNIIFTPEELNALKYVHGEGNDYCEERVMNELAGFCHACDVISARCFHDKKEI